MHDLVNIDSKKGWIRLLLGGVIIAALVMVWMGGKWQLGNMLASLTELSDPNAEQIADLAIDWAPRDPKASWLAASTRDGLDLLEKTVRLAPHDFRWRLELGRALEQETKTERAESEFGKAVELAPTYAYPRWSRGNFYLRQNRVDEAMSELKLAAKDNQPFRDQVFSLAWDYFEKDTAQIEKLAGDRPDARARVTYFLASRGYAEDSLRNWNLLSEDEKQANPEIARAIAHGFYLQRRFPQSLEFSRQLGPDADARPEMVTNASFEKGLGESPDARFGWTVARNDPKIDISSDARVSRDGGRSARLTFKNFVKPEFYNLFQTVVVQPGGRYRLSFWVRTENLKSAGPPLIDIANANDNRQIARSEPVPTGTLDWREMTLEFTAPENCNGINIRTSRALCGEDCPITGVLWYDDFEIRRQ